MATTKSYARRGVLARRPGRGPSPPRDGGDRGGARGGAGRRSPSRDPRRRRRLGHPGARHRLFPFAPPDQLDTALLGACAAVRACRRVRVRCSARTGWFGDDVLVGWTPSAADGVPCADGGRGAGAFPQWLPTAASSATSCPHLTVGERRFADLDTLRAAEADVTPALAVATTVREALLIAGSDGPASWRTVARLPLGAEPDLGAATTPLNGTHVGFDRGANRPSVSGSAVVTGLMARVGLTRARQRVGPRG